MSTAPNKTRRWEKPSVASASSTSTSAASAIPTPSSQLSSFVEELSDVERASHRAAFLHLLQSMTGNNVAVECTDGVKVTGVFHASTPFERKPHVVIVKGSRYFQADSSALANGANDGKTAVVEFSKVFNYHTTNKLDLVNRNYSSEFQTDTAIKKHGDMSYLSGRNLQSLDSSWLEPSGDMSLEGKQSNSGKTWDQFEANKRLFNVKDTYDENLYTKRLDLKSMTAEQIAHADRMAREIEGTLSNNIHLQEERGHVMEGEWDEEDRYSGVLRNTTEDGSGSGKVGGSGTGAAPNAWKRGIRLGGSATTSGAPSPATTTPGGGASVASAKAGTSKTVSPPPGVPLPTAGQATNSPSPKKASTTAATTGVAVNNEKVKSKPPSPVPATGDSTPVKPTAVKDNTTTKPPATTTTTVSSAGIASSTPPPAEEKTATTPAATAESVAEVTPEAAKTTAATAAKKLSASAAEFKPSWMKDPAPAEATPVPPPVSSPTPAGTVPMMNVPAVPTFVPQYPNVPYGIPMSPEGTIPGHGMYQNKVHSSPGGQAIVASPNMQPMMDMPPPYFDPHHMAGMALPPQQGYMPQQMYMPEGHIPPPQFMQMPMSGMPMQLPMGMPGMPMEYGMPMPMMMQPNGQPEFYPQQMMGMPAGMMSPGQQQHMQGGYGAYPGNSPMQGVYGQHMQGGFSPNMGSGQKMGYDKMRGPGGHKGGRGMKSHYNSGRGGGGYMGNNNAHHNNNNNNNNTGNSHAIAGNSPGTPMATGPTRSRSDSVSETSP